VLLKKERMQNDELRAASEELRDETDELRCAMAWYWCGNGVVSI
jgi:hypothetical protein